MSSLVETLRKHCKMTTAELSKRSGIHRRTIYNLEKGKCKLTPNFVYKLSKPLSEAIDLSYIAGLVDRKSSITITKNKAGTTKTSKSDHYLARFNFQSNEMLLCEMLRDVLGVGEVHKTRDVDRWSYYTTSKASEIALTKLYPYIRLKKPKINVLLKFREVLDRNVQTKQTLYYSGRIDEWDQDAANEEYEFYYQLIRKV